MHCKTKKKAEKKAAIGYTYDDEGSTTVKKADDKDKKNGDGNSDSESDDEEIDLGKEMNGNIILVIMITKALLMHHLFRICNQITYFHMDGHASKPHNYIFPNVLERQKLANILSHSIVFALDKMRF